MVPCSLSPSGPLHVGNGPMGTFFQFFFSAIFSYDLSRFYFWALGVPLLVGPWGLGLGLGLGVGLGLGFSIPMDCTGGPLQDALVKL